MAQYLVTGGAGFIGSHIVHRLLTDGHRVRVFDDFSTGKQENLQEVGGAGADRLSVIEGDLRNPTAVSDAISGVDGIFHQAALGSVPRSVENPGETHAVNATGTLNVLVAARDHGVRRVLFAGSSSVYGSLETLPKREDHPTRPLSPYGLTKQMGEEYLRIFRELYEMETVVLRYYNVFGPRQDPESQYAAVVPRFIRSLLDGERPEVHGDGEQSRDFTYVDNVVDANLLAMQSDAEAVSPGLFNVAVGGRHSINDLLKGIAGILETSADPIHTETRAGDVKHSQADISLIQERLGFTPGVTFEDGLVRTVEYFRSGPGKI